MVLLILLPMFIGLIQLALVLHVRNTLSSAAAEGARRAAVVGATPEDGLAKTREQIAGTLNERFADAARISATSVGDAPAYTVTIDAAVPVLGLGGPAVSFQVSGTAIREDAQ